MADIFEVNEIIEKIADGFEKAVMNCVGAHKTDAVAAVSEQLYSGIDGEDNYLSPTYDNDPYFNSPESRRWFGNAKGYKQWKYEITPPQPGARLGLAPRPEEVPNLWIDGTFHSTIEAEYKPGLLSIVTRDAEAQGIVAKYGDQILQLSSRGIGYMNSEFVKEAIERHLVNCGW